MPLGALRYAAGSMAYPLTLRQAPQVGRVSEGFGQTYSRGRIAGIVELRGSANGIEIGAEQSDFDATPL